MKVLVFAPHPDDDIIGCGGSIAKHSKNGNDVTVVYMTSGDAGDLTHSKEDLSQIRHSEAKLSSEVLGVKETIFLDIHDGCVEFDKEILHRLVEIIRIQMPDSVYMPHSLDAHRDHANTFILVNEAIRRAGFEAFQEYKGKPWLVKTVLCYEVWTPLQDVNYIEDITESIDTKISALKLH